MKTRSLLAIGTAIGLTAGGPPAAMASVEYFQIFNTAFRQQTGAASFTANSYQNLEAVITDNKSDLSSVSVTRPNSTVDDFDINNGYGTSPFYWNNYSAVYGDQTSFDADYGTGTWTFTADATSGTISTTLDDTGIVDYPDPVVLSDYDALQDWDATTQFQLTWNSFTPDPDAPNAQTLVFIYDSGGNLIESSSGANTYNSFTITNGLLTNGQEYSVDIYHSNYASGNSDPNFDNAVPQLVYMSGTTIYFTPQAVPEPGELVAMATGCLGLLIRRRRGQPN